MVGRIFRANPGYELVLLDRLAASEQQRIGQVEPGQDVYGALRPRPGSSLDWRVASRDTALLFFSLQTPGPLPAYLHADRSTTVETVVARLTLDRVLEVEHDGAFVSGMQAREALLSPASERPRGRIATLSIEALQYGQALDGMLAPQLSLRLYGYGQKPVSRALRRRFPDEATVQSLLGFGAGPLQRLVDARWAEVAQPDRRAYWRMWSPRRGSTARTGPGYKLYVSPDLDALPVLLPTVVEVFGEARGIRGFKIGRDVRGISRPDKLVAYFERLENLHTTAMSLQARLGDLPAHGVAFTAEIMRSGLLSWGVDPPPDPRFVGAGTRRSWRFWVADRLAEYLLAAKAEGDALTSEPWRFALDRLAVDGIDTDRWVPTSRVWSRQTESS